MSTAAFVLLAVAVAVVAGCAVIVCYIAWRLLPSLGRPDSGRDHTAESASAADDFTAPEEAEAPVVPNLIFAPEYLDREELTALATELQIPIDPVQIETTHGEQYATEVGRELEGRLTLPGVVEAASNVSTAETTTTLSQQAVATTRRRGFTALMADVVRALTDLGQLHTDLVLMPEEHAELAALADGLIIVYERWGLRDLPPTPQVTAPSATDVLARALAPSPPPTPPEPTPEQLLRDGADTLWRRTLEEVTAAKQRELAAIAQEGGLMYALEIAEWRVASSEDGSDLWLYNSQLRTRTPGPHSYDLTTRAVIRVPLIREHLTGPGRQRLVPGSVFLLAVFGRIGSYSEAEGTLTLHPTAIFSG